MKFKVTILVLASLISIQTNAAVPIFNKGGLGCGTIVSMRESTQRPLASELADEYGAPRTSGGTVGQILSYVPGVGLLGAVVGEVVASVALEAASSNLQAADRAKQESKATYKDVRAVEFKFDDGEVVNIPVYVVSGMRYKAGARLNAMVSPKYGQFALGANVLFASVPDIGDKDYNQGCQIDNAEARKAILDSVKTLVDESRIAKASERRVVVAAAVIAPVVVTEAVAPEAVAPQ